MGYESGLAPTLEELNAEEAKVYVGGIVFVSILMVIGIIGNLHVLFVYGFRMKQSNHRVFILCLGMLDLTTCCVGMLFVLVDLQKPFTFYMVSACKVLRFINYFMCTASGWILLVIAVDRYRKICVPLGKQMSLTVARVMCGVAMGVSLLTSWPAPVLYGHSTVETRVKNITGVRCYTADKFKDTKYQTYVNGILISITSVAFCILAVLYTTIGRNILKQKTFKSGVKSDIHSGCSEAAEMISTSDDCVIDIPRKKSSNVLSKLKLKFKNPFPSPANTQAAYTISPAIDYRRKLLSNGRRMTFMFFMITVFFFVSFVPHLILKIIAFVNPEFITGMTFAGKVAYNTFVWCFFINNMANPIIYGWCDRRFRKEIRNGYAKLLSYFIRH